MGNKAGRNTTKSGTDPFLFDWLEQIFIPPGVFDETGGGEVLQLLPDFVADMPVFGMQLLEMGFQCVQVLVAELFFVQRTDCGEDFEEPPALLDADFFQRFDPMEFLAHFLRWHDNCSSRCQSALTFRMSRLTSAATAGADDFNPRLGGDAMQRNVAANPPGAARGGGQRRTLDDGRRRKGEAGNQQQIFDGPGGEVVMEKIKIWGLVIVDGVHHGRVRAVGYRVSDARFLPLQLKPEFAVGAGKITRPRVVAQPAQ